MTSIARLALAWAQVARVASASASMTRAFDAGTGKDGRGCWESLKAREATDLSRDLSDSDTCGRAGDWPCPRCRQHVVGWRRKCRNCKAPSVEGTPDSKIRGHSAGHAFLWS